MADDLEYDDEGNDTLAEEFVNGFSVRYDVYPIILAVLIVVANSTALILVARKRKLQTVTNGILASLGLLHLTVLTKHLFATVVHALRFECLLTRKASTGLVFTVWLCAAFVSLIPLSWITMNDIGEDERLRIHSIYSIAVLILFLGVPLVTMVYCHMRMFALVRLYRRKQHAEELSEKGLNFHDDHRSRKSRRTENSRGLAGMLAVFLTCWAPYFIWSLWWMMKGWSRYHYGQCTFCSTSQDSQHLRSTLCYLSRKARFPGALCECLGCCRTATEDVGVHGTMYSLA
ncbi:hypothetical protein OS493_030715 [Desmophyllum pertusum]|uniref:G-protein coupled receptors family 1 profile domain-containing protein n=1 Tax=Desmophyllum pertusum TaxID=174260 RepID=A0A9W9Z939_9CNID|nr:hypothetical protein OS493_030715 [Desmophyllum pertusum]